ncbi:MAG: hypothetical protein HQ528_05190 [Candidatus Marinimicrobia bacterium]|nr:hypothetical protein [Candidatus Neomarinimicrobiota bacterium]
MKNVAIGISLLVGFQVVLFWGCDPGIETITGPDPTTCEGCHTSEAALKKFAHEDTGAATGGG